MQGKGLRRWELILILLALLVLAGFYLLNSRGGPSGIAHVNINGERVLELPLESTPNQTIDLSVYGVPASLEIEDGKIRFVNVTCPDHICEKTGWVWMDGQSAVCMPNRTAVVVTVG